MTATAPLLAPASPRLHVPSVTHFYCCNENVAWCGEDLSDAQDCFDNCGCQDCVVCERSFEAPCPYGCNA
jgi:hypothetical protein